MKIKIAICDDDKEICTQLEDSMEKMADENNHQIEIDVFYDGETLCKESNRTRYDLIFLDIEMPKVNGIDVGRYFRENLQNEVVQIVYISSKQKYAMELFEYHPLNFLVKPIDETKIKAIMDKYKVITNQNNHMFEYKKGFDYLKIPMANIFYFTSTGHKITVVWTEGEDSFYGSLDKIYSVVKTHHYLYIHKSIIGNYNFIKKINYTQVVMLDNHEFNISQSRRKEIREMHLAIKEEEMGWNK